MTPKKAKEDNIKAMIKEDKVERGVDMVNQVQEGDGEGDGQGQGQEDEGHDEGDEDDGWEDNQVMDQGCEDGEGQGAKEGNGKVVVEGKGQQGKAEIPAALAVAAPYRAETKWWWGTQSCATPRRTRKSTTSGRPRSSA